MDIEDTEIRELFILDKKVHGKINNQHIIIFGTTGSGKTAAAERIEAAFIHHGRISFQFDNKNALEPAFAQFPVEEHYHLKILERIGEHPDQLRKLAEAGNEKAIRMLNTATKPVKVYHPFTLEIPTHKIPQTNFFTIPVKELNDTMLNYLFEEERQSPSFKVFQEAIRKLKPDESIYHLMAKVRSLIEKKTKKIGSEDVEIIDPENWGQKSVAIGTVQQWGDISSVLKPFETHAMLAEETNSMNLNWDEIRKDREHIHVFSTRYITGNKFFERFVQLYILIQIKKHSTHSRIPFMIGYPEVGLAIPRKPKGGAQVFSKYFQDFASTIRTFGGSIVTDTQTITRFDTEAKTLFNYALFGNVGMEELDEYKQEYQLTKYDIEDLKTLGKGYFFLHGKTDRGAIPIKMPRHAHKEEGQNYDEVYEWHFPERMTNYREMVAMRKKALRAELDLIMEESRKDTRKKEEAEERRMAEKELIQNAKKELLELKGQVKGAKEEKLETRDVILRELYLKAETVRERSARTLSSEMAKKGFQISKSSVAKLLKKLGLVQNEKNFDHPPEKEERPLSTQEMSDTPP